MKKIRAGGWKLVVFAGDLDEDGNCPVCQIDYADCGCPGPTQDDLFEYEEVGGVMWARPIPKRAPKATRC
jgi:hypothetical protein